MFLDTITKKLTTFIYYKTNIRLLKAKKHTQNSTNI